MIVAQKTLELCRVHSSASIHWLTLLTLTVEIYIYVCSLFSYLEIYKLYPYLSV